MMLKLLIVACLVTHGLGRPDVSHILKRENQSGQRQQQPRDNRAFHPLDYLNRQLGDGREFEARAASESEYNVFDYLTAFNGTEINGLEGKPSSTTVGRRNGARSFRNIVKPSPFTKNAAVYGYTYEKPADPFDFPIHPDANLIKPVSTQAPEYLPPVEQGPLGGADQQPEVPGSQRPTGQSVVSTTSPSYPELTPGAVTTEGPYGYPSPQGPSAVLNQNGYGPPAQGSSPSPIDVSNQPDFTSSSATQSPQPAYGQQGSTTKPDEPSDDLKPTTEGEFTGYPQGPSSKPTPDTTGYPQGGVPTTTEGEFMGYPQGPSTTPSPDQASTSGPFVSSTGYPQEPSPGSPAVDNQFTGYPQGTSPTPLPDRESTAGPTPSSPDYPQETSPSSNGQPTGYPQVPSSTPSPDQGSFSQGPEQSSTGYLEGSTPTSSEFTGYPQGPSSTLLPGQGSSPQVSTPGSGEFSTGYPQASTPSPDQGVPGASQMPSNGYPQPPASGPLSENTTTQKPDFPPEVTASTTVGGHLTTQPSFNGQQGYNYEKPILPPNLTEVVGEPIDINDLATTTLPSTTTRKPSDGDIIPPKPRPDLVVPVEPSTSETPEQTDAPSTSSVEMTSHTTSPVPPVPVPSSTSAPEYLPPEATNPPEEAYDTTQRPSGDQTTSTGASSTTTAGYPSYSQEATTFTGYPSSERETTTASSPHGPIQESTTAAGLPESSQESTTFSGYPSATQTSTGASSYPSVIQETTTAGNYQTSVGPEITTLGGYPNAEVSTHDSGTSTGAPEYMTPSSTPFPDYQTTTASSGPSTSEFSTGGTFEPFNNVSAGGQPFPTRPTYESVQSTTSSGATAVPSSSAAPEYLPPDANGTSSQYYPPATSTSTPTPEYRPDQPVRPEIPSDNLVNQTSPGAPDYTDFNQVTQPAEPLAPMGGMAIISEINGLMPDNAYLPPDTADNERLRIVVDDTLSSNLFQSPSSRSSMAAPVPETDAEGSELQPQLALVASTSEGYNYQAPDERLPVPVIPSHTLDDEGYHYKIPSVPFP